MANCQKRLVETMGLIVFVFFNYIVLALFMLFVYMPLLGYVVEKLDDIFWKRKMKKRKR